MTSAGNRFVLASGSRARAVVLNGAGLTFEQIPAGVDEDVIKEEARRSNRAPERTALDLAVAKARAVAASRPSDLILAADQLLVLENAWFGKPPTMDAARETLSALSGKTHHLVNGVVFLRGGAVHWEFSNRAALTMRHLSPSAIDTYLVRAGETVLTTAGAYRLEGLGGQLFEMIEGDTFSIMGLPLTPVVTELARLSSEFGVACGVIGK